MNDSITLTRLLLRRWLLSDAFVQILATINASLAGFDELRGLTVPPPAIVYPFERAVAPERFPSAELLALNSSVVGDASSQQYRHNVDVLWTHAADDELTLVTVVECLVLATRRLTWRETLPMPDGTSAPIIPGAENYGPLMSRARGQTQPLVKGATIRLQVPTFGGWEN